MGLRSYFNSGKLLVPTNNPNRISIVEKDLIEKTAPNSNMYRFRYGLPVHLEEKASVMVEEKKSALARLESVAGKILLSKDVLLGKAEKALYRATGWSLFLAGSAAVLGGEPDAFIAISAGTVFTALFARASEIVLDLPSKVWK